MIEADLYVLEIGCPGNMDAISAAKAARVFTEIRAEKPDAFFGVTLGGFDDDPRDIWNIPEAASYVLLWARLAGIGPSDFDALRPIFWSDSFAALCACGVFGEEARRRVVVLSNDNDSGQPGGSRN